MKKVLNDLYTLQVLQAPYNVISIPRRNRGYQVIRPLRAGWRGNSPLLRIPRRRATPFQTLLIGNAILSHNFIYSSSSSQRRERKRIDSEKKIQNLGGQLTAKNQHLLIKQHQSHTKQTNIFVFPKSKQHQQKLVETFLIGKVLKLIEQLTLSTLPPFLSLSVSLFPAGAKGSPCSEIVASLRTRLTRSSTRIWHVSFPTVKDCDSNERARLCHCVCSFSLYRETTRFWNRTVRVKILWSVPPWRITQFL